MIYLALHRIEFTGFHYSLTCTCFLLHWSSHRCGRALPAMPLFGVRTFLTFLGKSSAGRNSRGKCKDSKLLMAFSQLAFSYKLFTFAFLLYPKTSTNPSGRFILMKRFSRFTSAIQSLMIGMMISFLPESTMNRCCEV